MASTEASFVHYLPIGTTLISAVFFAVLIRRYCGKGYGVHLLWWAAGVFCYGLGTLIEATISLTGNTVFLNKAWYIAGAILGGYPLAQGSIYMLLPRRTANILTAVTLPVLIAVSVLVAMSPVHEHLLHPLRPNGAILEWQWVRALTPLINGYAALFLIGLAVRSAVLFTKGGRRPYRVSGNWLIAIGAILPGIGGSMAKAGVVEGLYIGEFLGIILIWLGYWYCQRPNPVSEQAAQAGAARLEAEGAA
jgi:hypothetical protein